MGYKTAVEGDLGGIRGREQGRENERGSHLSMLFKADGSRPDSQEVNQELFPYNYDRC